MTAPLLGAGAQQQSAPGTPSLASVADLSRDTAASSFLEGFKTGTKTSYTTGSITLGSGARTLNDALIGNTTADAETGSHSAHECSSSIISMNFDRSGGRVALAS